MPRHAAANGPMSGLAARFMEVSTLQLTSTASTTSVDNSSSITVLDLFAGAGGLTAGFHSASERFNVKRAVELDPAAAASFEATYGKNVVYSGSIEAWLADEEVPNVDVIVGGPPCQGFSMLGKQDISDSRNTLWREYAATILRAKPKYFVVENVAAFAKSQQFQEFTSSTQRGGELEDYAFEWDVLNAADYGAFQARKRAILIGRHRDLPAVGMPIPTHAGAHRTVAEAFRGIPQEVEAAQLPVREREVS